MKSKGNTKLSRPLDCPFGMTMRFEITRLQDETKCQQTRFERRVNFADHSTEFQSMLQT